MNEIYLYKQNLSKTKNINIAMAYPSTYYYGMSVLGYLTIFKELDMNQHVSAQRIFLNSNDLAFDAKYLDMLGFSCVFELDILQILKILKKYKFNIEAKKRKRIKPLIFIGGPVVTSNPEPFSDFFDFMVIGDGEKNSDEIVDVYQKNKNKSKLEILKALSKIDGIYVPSLYETTYQGAKILSKKPLYDDINKTVKKRTAYSEECLYSPIISENTFYANTAFVEIARGCPYECKFCSAHWQNTPVRYFGLKQIKQAIKKASKYAKKIILIGAMISSHPNFEEICAYIAKLKEKRDFQVEFSGMSFDYHSKIMPDLIDEKTIALSIECGSEKLRYKTGKFLSDKQILKTIKYYTEKGIKKFNLYFMVGLPDETLQDIDNYIDFTLGMVKQFPKIEFCHIISTFNPKPHTPYEREKRDSNANLFEKLDKIKTVFEKNNIGIVMPVVHNDNFNALISLGDKRLGKYIQHISEQNTPVKNMFKEYKIFMKKYNQKLDEKQKLPHYSYYCYTKKSTEEILPWSFVEF